MALMFGSACAKPLAPTEMTAVAEETASVKDLTRSPQYFPFFIVSPAPIVPEARESMTCMDTLAPGLAHGYDAAFAVSPLFGIAADVCFQTTPGWD